MSSGEVAAEAGDGRQVEIEITGPADLADILRHCTRSQSLKAATNAPVRQRDRRETNPISLRRQNQPATPRPTAPFRRVVQRKPITYRNSVCRCILFQVLGHNPRLDLIAPTSLPFGSDIPFKVLQTSLSELCDWQAYGDLTTARRVIRQLCQTADKGFRFVVKSTCLDVCGCATKDFGSVAEWFMALVLKTSVGGTPPWVRIPPLPPIHIEIIG